MTGATPLQFQKDSVSESRDGDPSTVIATQSPRHQNTESMVALDNSLRIFRRRWIMSRSYHDGGSRGALGTGCSERWLCGRA